MTMWQAYGSVPIGATYGEAFAEMQRVIEECLDHIGLTLTVEYQPHDMGHTIRATVQPTKERP